MEGKRDYTNQEGEKVELENEATTKAEDLTQEKPITKEQDLYGAKTYHQKCHSNRMREQEATMKREELTQERDIAKENHAERMREQEAKANQIDADLKTIKAALDVANRKGAYTLEEAYVIASASKRLF